MKEPQTDPKGKRIVLCYEPPKTADLDLMRALRACGCKAYFIMQVANAGGAGRDEGLTLNPSGIAFRLDRAIKLDEASGKTPLGPNPLHRAFPTHTHMIALGFCAMACPFKGCVGEGSQASALHARFLAETFLRACGQVGGFLGGCAGARGCGRELASRMWGGWGGQWAISLTFFRFRCFAKLPLAAPLQSAPQPSVPKQAAPKQ